MAQFGWRYIDTFTELSDKVQHLSCDTRQFDCYTTLYHDPEIHKLLEPYIAEHPNALFDKDEILPFLKQLEAASGGNAYARVLRFNNSHVWWKYMRFDKLDSGKFFCWTSTGNKIIPCDRNIVNPENIKADIAIIKSLKNNEN